MQNKVFFVLFLLVPLSFLSAQSEMPNSDAYVWFDKEIGIENSGLYVGKEYKENFKFKNRKHKFFEINGFQKGSVIYNGQPYFNVLLKLDVFENELLVKLPIEKGISAFTLIKDEVESFTIEDNKFVKIKLDSGSEGLSWQYREVLFEAETFLFLKNHFAVKKTIKDKRWSYVEFLKKDSHALLYKGNYYPIRNKRDILKIFPESKKILKKVSQSYFKGPQSDANLVQLFSELNQQISVNEADKV